MTKLDSRDFVEDNKMYCVILSMSKSLTKVKSCVIEL